MTPKLSGPRSHSSIIRAVHVKMLGKIKKIAFENYDIKLGQHKCLMKISSKREKDFRIIFLSPSNQDSVDTFETRLSRITSISKQLIWTTSPKMVKRNATHETTFQAKNP